MKVLTNFYLYAKALFLTLGLLPTVCLLAQQYPATFPTVPKNIPIFNCGPVKKSTVSSSKVVTNNILAGCTGAGVKYLSVNIHYMLLDDGTGNFSEYDDGYPVGSVDHRPGVTGYTRAQTVIDGANKNWASNVVNWHSPSGTPALPKRIQLVLKNVYFHHSTAGVNETFLAAPYFNDINNTYGVNTSSEINVFMTRDLAPQGTSISGVTPVVNSSSNVLGYLIIFMKDWDLWYPKARQFDRGASNTINHEIGYALGLEHDFDPPPITIS